MQAPVLALAQKSYNPFQQTFQHDISNGVTTSITREETCLPCMCQKLICPSNAKYKPHVPSTSCACMRQLYISSYGPTAINNVTRNTALHTIHIIGICPQTNILPTSHLLLQWSTCRSQITANISSEINLQQLFPTLLLNMC